MSKAAPLPFRIELSPAAMRQTHELLAGGGHDLRAVLEDTRAAKAKGPVEWVGVLTPDTLHGLGALCALAADEGARVNFYAEGLDERQTAFLADYETHGPPSLKRPVNSGPELTAAAHEAAYALWQMRPRLRRIAKGKPVKAVIIGAYGGDHVGDTAILGGVLLHLNKTFGVTEAEVLSHRPGHTARLVKGLSSPVKVSVFDYTPRLIGQRLKDAGLLVIAGGPMMDLPRVLAKHLAAVHLAKSLGIPFHVERVGVGPFKRQISRWAARKLFILADGISLRTSGAGLDPTLKGLAYTVGRDPAFDYLATRKVLDRTTEAAKSADALLAGTKGNILIGLNLRPIRHEWAGKGAAFSKSMDAQFFDELAQGMVKVAEKATKPVTFVFFPMNPIEFGMSDLAAAWRLHKLLGDRVDFRVWQADPDIDDVLYLIRRMDGVLAMRFHAAIFSLSQGVKTLGFDYYPGQGGKVEQLFADFGRPGDAVRLDAFTSGWLVAKLKAVATPKLKAEQHG